MVAMQIIPFDDTLLTLRKKQRQLEEKLAAEKRKSAELLEKRKKALQRQIARIRYRLSTQERKQETRWKILVGATILASVKNDPAATGRLDRKMNEALTEPRDRALWRSGARLDRPSFTWLTYWKFIGSAGGLVTLMLRIQCACKARRRVSGLQPPAQWSSSP